MFNQNKIVSIKIQRQAKNVFLSDVERTVILHGLGKGGVIDVDCGCKLVELLLTSGAAVI